MQSKHFTYKTPKILRGPNKPKNHLTITLSADKIYVTTSAYLSEQVYTFARTSQEKKKLKNDYNT